MKQPTVTKKKRTLANGGKVSQVPGLNNNIVYRIYKHEAGDRSESTLDLLSEAAEEIMTLRSALALASGELSTYRQLQNFAPDLIMQEFIQEARRG